MYTRTLAHIYVRSHGCAHARTQTYDKISMECSVVYIIGFKYAMFSPSVLLFSMSFFLTNFIIICPSILLFSMSYFRFLPFRSCLLQHSPSSLIHPLLTPHPTLQTLPSSDHYHIPSGVRRNKRSWYSLFFFCAHDSLFFYYTHDSHVSICT